MNRVIRASVELACKKYRYGQVLQIRRCTTPTSSSSSDSGVPRGCSATTAEVPGLSKNTVNVPTTEVGFPGASKTGCYKNPEYFSYHNASYFEAEVEMKQYRLPQPSNKVKK